jgi:hypothetical protein
MPFFLLGIGMIFLVAAIRGNQADLINLLKDDFSGANNFFIWVLAIVVIVALGNIKAIRPISDAFLGLVILVIIVANYRNQGDIFNSFIAQIKAGTTQQG